MGSNNSKINELTSIANFEDNQRDTFLPAMAGEENVEYNWWIWFFRAHYEQYMRNGTIPGYKERRGDNAHKHHRLHIFPDHAINFLIWQSTLGGTHSPVRTLTIRSCQCTCWYGGRQTLYILNEGDKLTMALTATITFTVAMEDISIKFNPLFIGQSPRDIAIRQRMGPTIGTLEISDW
eukprot:2234452-Amphidinium_carterae.1